MLFFFLLPAMLVSCFICLVQPKCKKLKNKAHQADVFYVMATLSNIKHQAQKCIFVSKGGRLNTSAPDIYPGV